MKRLFRRIIIPNCAYAICLAVGVLLGTQLNKSASDKACIHTLDPGHKDLPELIEGYHGLKSQSAFLVIVIVTGPKNYERRKVIRDTWLNIPKILRPEVRHFFVIGDSGLSDSERAAILDESATHKDILRIPVEESFNLLTNKVLATYVRLNENFKFDYLMKVDDDSFVRVPDLLDELKNSNYKKSLYWGFFDGRAPVLKSEKNKWKEKNYVLCDKYIPYALGGGYVLSHDLVHFISENSDHLQMFSNEDVAVGTWLAPLKVNRVHDPRFDTEFRSRGCSNKYLVSHKQSVEEMKSKQYSLNAKGILCEKERRLRKSYNYDWSKPPSQCCMRTSDANVP